MIAITILTGAFILGKTYDNPDAWKTRITAQCGAEKLENGFELAGFFDIGNVPLGFGTYLGLLFSLSRYPTERVATDSVMQSIIWTLTWVVLVVPVLVF